MSKRAFETADIFEKEVKKYIAYCKKTERLANVAGFSVFANINQDTFYAQKDYYSETFKKVNDMLEDEAINNKNLNDARIIFYMKNKCGYKDKQEQEIKETGRYNIINDLPKGETDEQ